MSGGLDSDGLRAKLRLKPPRPERRLSRIFADVSRLTPLSDSMTSIVDDAQEMLRGRGDEARAAAMSSRG
jgi:hypothetical protein